MAIFSFCEGFFSFVLQRTQKTFYLHTHGSSRNVRAHTWLCQSEVADHIRVRAPLNICSSRQWCFLDTRAGRWTDWRGRVSVMLKARNGECAQSHTQVGMALSPTPIKSPKARVLLPKAIQILSFPCPTFFIDLRITFQALQGHQRSSPCLLLDLISLLSTAQTHESAFGTSITIH